jgi:hypothetical protein
MACVGQAATGGDDGAAFHPFYSAALLGVDLGVVDPLHAEGYAFSITPRGNGDVGG